MRNGIHVEFGRRRSCVDIPDLNAKLRRVSSWWGGKEVLEKKEKKRKLGRQREGPVGPMFEVLSREVVHNTVIDH